MPPCEHDLDCVPDRLAGAVACTAGWASVPVVEGTVDELLGEELEFGLVGGRPPWLGVQSHGGASRV